MLRLHLFAAIAAILCALAFSTALRAGQAAKAPPEPKPPASRPTTNPAKFKDIDVETFDKMRAQKGIVILDVRTPEEYEAAHLPGAILIDVTEPDFRQRIAGLKKDKVYLVHCATGRRSVTACRVLSDAGFKDLHNLLGGIRAWQAAGKEVEKSQ